MENYINVLGYEGLYEISNKGNVRSISRNVPHIKGLGIRFLIGRNLTPTLNKKTGYLCISVSAGGVVKKYNIHQLMGICFLGLKPDGTNNKVIDHIDNNKLNNNLYNLRITTNRINCSKNKRGISKYTGVHWSKNDNKWRSCIRYNGIKKHLGSFVNEIDAHNAYQTALNGIN